MGFSKEISGKSQCVTQSELDDVLKLTVPHKLFLNKTFPMVKVFATKLFCRFLSQNISHGKVSAAAMTVAVAWGPYSVLAAPFATESLLA